MTTASYLPMGSRGMEASYFFPSFLVLTQTMLLNVPFFAISGTSVRPRMEGQAEKRKSSRSAPTVQSKFLTRVINWHSVDLLLVRRMKGIFSSSSFFSSILKATGNDFSLSSCSMRRISFSQSIFSSAISSSPSVSVFHNTIMLPRRHQDSKVFSYFAA